jgi:peptidoglycan/LPS O-acetylase OafA/YrhL
MCARSADLPGVTANEVSASRISELDAVRGIAALVVVLHHCWETLLPDQNTFPFLPAHTPLTATLRIAAWINLSPLKLLFCGRAAVGLFFVLSGLVLSRQIQANAAYGQFLVRRVFRIWVPFALVILAAAALALGLSGPLPQLPWINESWSVPVTWQLVAGHLLMLGIPAYVTLDNPIWSLIHEMRISLVFPLLARLAGRGVSRLLAGSVALFTLLSITHLTGPVIAQVHSQTGRELLHSLVDTARYCLFFVLGIVLATRGDRITERLRQLPAARRRQLWALAFLLLAIPYVAGYLELAYALGAALLLALCMGSPRVRQWLAAPWLTWLGKVSYSLYLVHLLVLLTLVHTLRGLMPLPVILALAVTGSFAAAALCNRLIEMPANRLGRRLAGWLGSGSLASQRAGGCSSQGP